MITIYLARVKAHRNLDIFKVYGLEEAYFQTLKSAEMYVASANEGLDAKDKMEFDILAINVYDEQDVTFASEQKENFGQFVKPRGEC